MLFLLVVLSLGTLSCLGLMIGADVVLRCPKNTHLTEPVGSKMWQKQRAEAPHPDQKVLDLLCLGSEETNHQCCVKLLLLSSLWETKQVFSLSMSPQTSWSPAKYCKIKGDSCNIGCSWYFIIFHLHLRQKVLDAARLQPSMLASADNYTSLYNIQLVIFRL